MAWLRAGVPPTLVIDPLRLGRAELDANLAGERHALDQREWLNAFGGQVGRSPARRATPSC